MSKSLQLVDPPRIWSRICDLAIEDAERPAVSFIDGAEFSRAAVVTLAEEVAAGIQRTGVEPGDRVATMLDNGIEIIATWLACLRIGAVLVPLNTSMRGPILTHMLRTSEPSLIICEAEYAAQTDVALPADHRCAQVVVVGEPIEVAATAVAAWGSLLGPGEIKRPMARPEEPAAILFTSGTTGPSKGVVWSELTEVGLARGADLVADFAEDDVSYVTLPLFHANGLFVSLLPALFVGARSVIDDRFSVSNFWSRIVTHGATVTSLLGIMAPLLMQREAAELDRAHALRRALVVPAPTDREGFESRFGTEIRTFYALTDAGMPIGMRVEASELPAGSCGAEMPDWECRLVDADDRQVPVGTPGELALRPRTPGVGALGYWRNDGATSKAWRNLWCHTGDLMTKDENGWFYFKDRNKDAIRRSGENVSSFEVEAVVNSHPAVSEVAVYAVPSDLAEDDIMACVVLGTGASVEAQELAEFCRPRLPYFAVPRYFEFRSELPKTATQKVAKEALRREGRGADTVDVGPTRRGASSGATGAPASSPPAGAPEMSSQ